MITVKPTKTDRMKLIDAMNNEEAVTIQLSSRMVVDPDKGVNGSVTLPLTTTQLAKLNKSQRATKFSLSKTQVKKLMKGSGFFGSLWGGIKKGVSAVANVGKKVVTTVAPMVLDKAVDAAVAAAPALLLGAGLETRGNGNPVPLNPEGRKIRGSLGVARFRQPTNGLSSKKGGVPKVVKDHSGVGGVGGEDRRKGKMVNRRKPPVVNQNVSAGFYITDT